MSERAITMAELDPIVPAAPRPLPASAVWLGRAFITAWAGSCLLLLLCGAMTRAVTYDEDQYVAAGAMALHLMPYRDFAYLQAPLYPLVLAPFFAVAHGWFLLMARLVSFGFATCSGLLLWHLVRRLGAGLGLSMLLLTACLASPFLLAPLANARNDGLPLLLLLAGLAVHLWVDDPGVGPGVVGAWLTRVAGRPWAFFLARILAALLLGLAAEAKVSYVFAPFLIALHAAFAPRGRVLPTALGLLLAAAPAVFFLSAAPEGFLFGLIEYHLHAPAAWYTAMNEPDLLLPWARIQALAGFLTLGGNVTLAMLAAVFALVVTGRKRSWKRPGGLLVGMTAGATLCAMLPAPTWAMYFAPVAPLLACCIAHLNFVLTYVAGVRRKRILLLVSIVPMLPFLWLQVSELPGMLDHGNWVGVDAHRNAQHIRDALITSGATGTEVATLFPLWVIDANEIRPEFSTGPFVFRSGDSFDAGLLGRLHALSPSTLGAALDADPPDAIYAGRYGTAWRVPMDAALASYAQAHGWRLVRTDDTGGRLWLRPRG